MIAKSQHGLDTIVEKKELWICKWETTNLYHLPKILAAIKSGKSKEDKPEVKDTTMSMPSGTNGVADSTKGSGTCAVERNNFGFVTIQQKMKDLCSRRQSDMDYLH